MNKILRCALLLVPALLAQPEPQVRCGTTRTSRHSNPAERPLAGAIRWDAWHGDRGVPGRAVQIALAPEQYQYRLPFFAKVVSDSQVVIDGASQDVMDQEIEYAVSAGLDYWAFVTYDENDSMFLGLKLFLSSERKRGMKFSLITEHGRWGSQENYKSRITRFAGFLKEESYLKVLNGRPLVYLGFIQDDTLTKNWGGIEGFRKAVDEFRDMARQNGSGDPYIVIMEPNPVRGATLAKQLGADAISAYAAQGGESAAPYSALAAYAQRFWDRCRATGSAVVPIVMSGWDRRPRIEYPMPWETWQQAGVGLDKYYEPATPWELAGHLERAMLWIEDNPNAAPARAALIYAWNENDEGGWLTPTLCDGAIRLDAVRQVLSKPR